MRRLEFWLCAYLDGFPPMGDIKVDFLDLWLGRARDRGVYGPGVGKSRFRINITLGRNE